MRRLPLRLLRSAAAAASSSPQGPAATRGGWPVPPALHLAAPTAAEADLARWPQRRGYSQFASGFTPLQRKPLESILDVERAKGLSPEHLVAAWDDDLKTIKQEALKQALTHYTEFAETKDKVLVRGDVVFTSKLTDSEAKTLLETAHSFYLNDVRYKLVECFNKETHEFEFKDVLQVLDMPTM